MFGEVSAHNLVLSGITGDPQTATCQCLVERYLRGAWDDDANEVPCLNSMGVTWYKRCKGVDERYWDEHETSGYRRLGKREKMAIGLPASDGWRTARQGQVFMVLCLQRCAVEHRTGVPAQLKWKFGNAYCILRNEDELLGLYDKLPPGDRFLQEVILPSTPHKLVMDIEKDFDDVSMSPEEMDAEMRDLKLGLFEMFIPFLCLFFSEKLGIAITPEDCYVTDSSKRGTKYSVHLVVTTREVHYFHNRMECWIVVCVLAKYMAARATADERFKKWFFHLDERNRLRTTWDYGIYTAGARNMRLIGACKGDKKVLHSQWTDCRVFVPVAAQRHAPYHCFVATAYGYAAKKRIPITPELAKEAHGYCLEMLGLRVSPYWFQNSRGLAGKMVRAGYIDQAYHAAARGARAGAHLGGHGGGAARDGAAAPHHAGPAGAVNALAEALFLLGTPRPGEDALDTEIRQHQNLLRVRFMNRVRAVLDKVAHAVHPGNPPHIQLDSGRNGVVAQARLAAWIGGNRDNGRRCFMGCSSGSHQVVISCRVDFSVDYFCHACRQRATLVPTPIKASRAQPCETAETIPTDFADSVLDYATTEHDAAAGETPRHMRNIRPLANGRYLGDFSTVILRGPMGAGKTVATKRFLTAVRAENPSATILAISFRKMLAAMFADAYDLELYTASENLADENAVAVQMESLEKLGRPFDVGNNHTPDGASTGMALAFRARYDVVVLDEVESVLAHFSSSTMSDRLAVVWKLFYHMVRRCSSLVVCDADAGARTYQFLRMTRRHGMATIKNLQYHVNRTIAIRTRYTDYASLVSWKDAMVAMLLQGKNVFFFSNDKAFMRRLERYLRDHFTSKRNERITEISVDNGRVMTLDDLQHDPLIATCNDLLANVLVIDADTSETEKRKLTRCNEEWVTKRVVMISPTVGAGIDFTRNHFHATFGYATHSSCCARSWNQMRGRCRVTVDGECHVYIHDNVEYDLKQEDEMVLEGPTEGMPLTLGDAMRALAMNRSCYTDDMSVVAEMRPNGEEHLVARTTTIPVDLQTILALNMVEQNRSRICFRGEFIRLLQKNDPDVDYRLLTHNDLKQEAQLKLDLLNMEADHRDAALARVAVQPDMDQEQFKEAVSADMAGMAESPDMFPTLHKNEVKHFYGLRDDIDHNAWENIIRVGGDRKVMERVRNFAYIFGANMQTLYKSATKRGVLKSLQVKLVSGAGNNHENHELTVGQRTAQEVWPGDHVVRLWASKLMHAAGFAMKSVDELNKGDNPGEMLTPSGEGGEMSAHSALAEERLQDPELQAWLNRRHLYIKEKSGVRNHSNNTPRDGVWKWKHISSFTKDFLEMWFNLEARKSAPMKRKRDEGAGDDDATVATTGTDMEGERHVTGLIRHDTTNYKCAEHSKCKLMSVTASSLQTMLSLSQCFLEAPYLHGKNEPPIRVTAREQIGRVMAENEFPQIMKQYVRPTATNHANNHADLHRWAEEHPVEGDADNPLDQETDQEMDGYGYGDYGGYGADLGADDMYQYPNTPNTPDTQVEGADGPENEEPELGGCPLAELKTIAERNLRLRTTQAASRTNSSAKPEEVEKEKTYRNNIAMRYVGPSPYTLEPVEFAVLLLSNAYQARVERAIRKL